MIAPASAPFVLRKTSRYALLAAPFVIVAGLWATPGLVVYDAVKFVPPEPVAAAPSDGHRLFAKHCASCHGEQGDGNGTANLNPRARHFGLWWSLTSRITEVESPVRFEDVQERGPFSWFRHEHRFEAVGGVTRMYDHWEHRSPLGPIGRVIDRLVLGRYMRSLLATRNAALKRAAETP